MSRWAYYSPVWLGTLVAAALYLSSIDQLPAWPKWVHVLLLGVGCPLIGLQCQVLRLGTQGAFAQVLPVPIGRSIRGRGAVVAGALLIAWFALVPVAGFLWMEELHTTAYAIAAAALGSLIVALIVYFWCMPIAVRDFDGRE